MDVCPIVRVKPWGKDQGDFVEINLADYDPAVHKLHGDEPDLSDPLNIPSASAETLAEAAKPAPKPAPKRRRKAKR